MLYTEIDEIQKLRKTNAALVSEIKTLKYQLAIKNKLHKKQMKQKIVEMLSPFFTSGQIKMYMNPKQKMTRWSPEDISAAISLKSVSPKAYKYLRKTKQIPLPAMSTLRRWVINFNIDEGILKDVLLIMKGKSQNMTEMERATVLCFDEIHLSNLIQIERKKERAVGPHKKCQVVLVRGLLKKWKQPVFYAFDQDVTKEILLNILTQLYNSGYTVYAMTSDMGQSNQNLLKKLDINENIKTFFQHPCDEDVRIHVFLDAPHLLKLLRNHFLDSGIHVNGHFITSAALERMLQINSADLKIVHKFSQTHLNVQGPQRQNVKLATQLFSATNAAAIEWCGSRALMDNCPEWAATAKFLKLFNDWFDLFNSVCKYGSHSGVNAYGVNILQQNQLLTEVTSVVTGMRVGSRQSLLPFQKGIIICNSSLPNLYDDLRKKFNTNNAEMSYVITNRLNQDVLENLFSYIRAMGAANDRPTALDIRYRLRWYILGKHSANFFTEGTNTSTYDDSIQETCLTNGIADDLNEEPPVEDDIECNFQNII